MRSQSRAAADLAISPPSTMRPPGPLAFSRLIEAFGIGRLAISIGEQDDLKSFADDF
jgi:hypothetical protein